MHGIQTVTEHRLDNNKGTVLLECGCSRPLFSSDAIACYEDEQKIRSGSKRVAGNRMYQVREKA